MSAPVTTPLDPAGERAMAAVLFNRAWELLELPARTPEQDDELVHAAHASRHHWGSVGEPQRVARGEWLCARVYSVLGRAEPALHHARRCLALNEASGERADWDLAAAFEAMARAEAVAGDLAASRRWRDRAAAELASITGAADREVIERDIATLP